MELFQTTRGSLTSLGVETKKLVPSSHPERENEVRSEAFVWRPGPKLSQNLPTNFELRICCLSGGDGIRRILPEEPLKGFLLQASLIGHAILRAEQTTNGEQDFAYHAMRLIFQKAGNLQEKLTRTFHRAQDLHLTAGERFEPDVKDILPEMVGQNPQNQGHRWSVKELMNAGRRASVDAGRSAPAEEECIRRGLWEAACLAPIDYSDLPEDELMALIRLAVFDFGPADGAVSKEEKAQTSELAERVIERLLKAIEKHSDHDTEDFDRWFFDKADNLIHQIAKKKDKVGPIERPMVRQVILETVSRSFRYLGDCVHLAMAEIAECLSEALSPEERSLFEANYYQHPALGGLPLVMLFEQFAILKEAIPEICGAPNDKKLWGTLLRYLQYHAEMVRNKRNSEKHYKRLRHHHNEEGKTTRTDSLLPTISQPSQDSENPTQLLQAIATELREREQSTCQCGTTDAWFAELDIENSTPEIFVFADRCSDCGYLEHRHVNTEDARRLIEV